MVRVVRVKVEGRAWSECRMKGRFGCRTEDGEWRVVEGGWGVGWRVEGG